jgi:8-oxo-dGTP pyrophosphatase MutT (NUDIX family)
MRFLGLEWAWRFFQQGKGTRAWRLRRICRAVCVFPAYFLKWQFINPFLYRKNVACLVYRKITSGKDNQAPGFQVLILERKQEPGHWQLPQGGRDGEDIMTAGLRELGEELNCRKIRPVAAFANVYRYKFGQRKHEDTDRKQRVYQHYHYKGQRQGLLVAEFIGDSDEDISVNYWEYQNWKWVEPGQLLKEVHPIRQKATEIFLQKFQKVVNDPRYKL